MEIRYGGRLPEWRYRAISGCASGDGQETDDEYQAEGESRLAAAGLPWCFGEMSYPHWRRVPITDGDRRNTSYFAGECVAAREAALTRMILCSRCPVFERCHKITIAKKSPNPAVSAARRKADMLAALGRM